MAKIPLKEIKFPDLADTYTIPQVDNTLTTSGDAADAKKTGDEIDALKEDLSTLNTEGTVPTSEQMLSDNVTVDSVPYHFRKTASDNADREELEIVGGSVAWNQLERFNRTSETINNVSYTNNGDGSFTITGQASANTPVLPSTTNTSAPYIEGHVYYGFSNIASASDSTVSIGIYINATLRALPGTACVLFKNVTEHFTGNIQIGYRVTSGYNPNGMTIKGGLIDLTQALEPTIAEHIYSLEQATAGAGVALVRSLFNKDYYPFDAGSIQSVSGLSEHKTVGFNQWDEEWENGSIDAATGENVTYEQRIRSKNYIPVLPNTSYCYFQHDVTATKTTGRVCYYDANKNFVGGSAQFPNGGADFIGATVFTTPSNARYMRFSPSVNYGSSYAYDICINLSDPAKNGTYEPYDGHSYALDDSLTLRGIPTLVDGKIKWDGDVYSPSGKVSHKYALIELGSRTWTLGSDSMFQCAVDGGKAKSTKMLFSNGKYTPIAEYNTAYQTNLSAYINSSLLRVKDDSYADAASFKTAMNGVYVLFELATLTTEQADPYVSPQICSPYGTEEFVSTGIVPVGHNTKYPDNLRMKLDNLPWNFASLIAPTESGYTATRNYTTGQLLIVNNVLYKATANIANGGTITPNTNVTATTLAEVISALS